MDYTWFEDVQAYLDRDHDLYHFPQASAERLGEVDDETGNFYLIDGLVEATPDEVDIDGATIPVWSVEVTQLLTRPAKQRR